MVTKAAKKSVKKSAKKRAPKMAAPIVCVLPIAPVGSIIAYKGFDMNLKCRSHQYEVGKTYEHDGAVIRCESGFHSCEHPLDVFNYYVPAQSRYARITASGEFSRESGDDTKLASARISIDMELKLPDLIASAVQYVFDRAKWNGKQSATGDKGAASATGSWGAASATGSWGAASATGSWGAASATGYQGAASATGSWGAASATGSWGAASATGYQGAASATGDKGAASATGSWGAASATGSWGAASATGSWGAASATGSWGAASATGYQGAASATGYQGAASATGVKSVACGIGYASKALAGETGAIVLCFRDVDYNIIHIRASKVGENGIKPNVWYSLNADGEFVEAI